MSRAIYSRYFSFINSIRAARSDPYARLNFDGLSRHAPGKSTWPTFSRITPKSNLRASLFGLCMPNWIAINARCRAKPSSGDVATRQGVFSHFHKLICTSARPVYKLSRRTAPCCAVNAATRLTILRGARYVRCSVYIRRECSLE